VASNEATPVALILDKVLIAPVEEFSLIEVNPPFERTGPLNVELAMSISCLG
jgi:16S rRNA G1207 methylase RsmC